MARLDGLKSRVAAVGVVESRLHAKLFKRFAEKLDFVYFGYVDQRDDEHRVIRGLTLSNSHRDDHYSIGTYHGYDMAMCERVDTITNPGVPSEHKTWLIMTADLHNGQNLPHIFIGLQSHTQGFYRHVLTKFSYLQKLEPGSVVPYSLQFREHFTLYTTPTHFVLAEGLFGNGLEAMLAEHFSDFSFEISDGTLYVYSENQKPNDLLLSRMLQCAAWLANELDKR